MRARGGALTALGSSPYTALSDLGSCRFDQNGTSLFGILASGEISVRSITPGNGAVAAGPADLAVSTNEFFAVTN